MAITIAENLVLQQENLAVSDTSNTYSAEMELSDRIRRLREQARLTQEELAARVGVGQSAVQQWESGKSAPKRTRLAKVAKELHVTVEGLLDSTAPAGELDIDVLTIAYRDARHRLESEGIKQPSDRQLMGMLKLYYADHLEVHARHSADNVIDIGPYRPET